MKQNTVKLRNAGLYIRLIFVRQVSTIINAKTKRKYSKLYIEKFKAFYQKRLYQLALCLDNITTVSVTN